MKQQRFDEAQIIGILKQQESGVTVDQICREHAISEGTFYRWKSKYGGMEVHEATRLRQLEQENARLKKLLAESMLASVGTGKCPAQKAAGRVHARQRRPQGCAVKKMVKLAVKKEVAGYIQHDTLNGGRRFRTLNIVDCFSREALAAEVDTSLTRQRVVRVLQRLIEMRGNPQVIQVDNGPEFTGRALDEWAHKNQIKLHFIELGKLTQNGVIESFNGKTRDECLNLA